jgi:hypothetical protein
MGEATTNGNTRLSEDEVLEVEVKKVFGGSHVIFIRTEKITNIFGNFYPVSIKRVNGSRPIIKGLEYAGETYKIIQEEATFENGQRYYVVDLLNAIPTLSSITQKTVFANEMFKYIRNKK